MSGFLYFLDGWINPVTDAVLDAHALRYAFESPPMHGMISGRTPSGNPGTLLADEARLAGMAFAFDGENQLWRKAPPVASVAEPGKSRVWVGYWRDARPLALELERIDMRTGRSLLLGDNQEWILPQLLFYARESGFTLEVPTRANLDDSGQWVAGDVLPQADQLTRLADRLYEGMVLARLGRAALLTTGELLDVSCELLALNYVVGRVEVAMLGLWNMDATLAAAAKIAVDWETATGWLEKKSVADVPLESVG